MSIPAGPLPGPDPTYSGIVTVDELRQHMSGIELTDDQVEDVARTLFGTQLALERYLNRPVEIVQVRELLHADGDGFLNPSATPIWKVVSMTHIGYAWEPNLMWTEAYIPPTFTRDPMLGVNDRMIDWLTAPNVGDPLVAGNGVYAGSVDSWHVLNYVGGYDGRNDWNLKVAIMEVAARSIEPTHDDAVSLRGDRAEQAAASDPRLRGWTDDELRRFDRLRRRVVQT